MYGVVLIVGSDRHLVPFGFFICFSFVLSAVDFLGCARLIGIVDVEFLCLILFIVSS